MENNNQVVLFEEYNIRKVLHSEEWYFSVIDVVKILSESTNPRNYWNMLKKREPQLNTVCVQLKMPSTDGKNYLTDTANTEGVFRIMMSVSSPKAEPFKLWLAQVGKQHIDEIEDPELGFDRLKDLELKKPLESTGFKRLLNESNATLKSRHVGFIPQQSV